ncbi:MAG: hypothetical protein IT242_00940 [Bacteroidia bacterium]|nr:hypothetical protein [Bacteroidia bacterium]
MSLSREQKKDLEELGRYLKKIERLGVENNIDLDVYMSEYKDNGYAVYATENVSMEEKAATRKKVFEKKDKERTPKAQAGRNH